RINERIAALQIRIAHPVLELLADNATLRMEENQSRTSQFLNTEQIEFLADLPVIALLRLFELVEVIFNVLLRKEDGAVDALELFILLVALPVRAGNRRQSEGLELRSIRHVRTAAEIDEVRPEGVFGKRIIGLLLNELDLHGLIHFDVLLNAFRLAGQPAFERETFGLQLPHPLFNLFEIFGRERLGAVEIIVKTGFDGRPDAQLRFRKKLQHRGGAKMGGRVAIDLQRLFIFVRQDLNRAVALEGSLQIVKTAVHFRDQRRVGQARADRLSDLKRARSGRNLLDASVRQGNL